ncbi:MAG: hypothetical protein IT348_20205 [Candidatus Eisenbacteria bacterium]|nr:hypothetical protein [Candidatus Eisenbacteria bacterium]
MTAHTKHPFAAKLDHATAEEIRARHRAGEAPRTLALEYGVARSSLYEVLRGRTHQGLLVLRLRPVELARLEQFARELELSPGELAARCIERALTPEGRL